MRKKASLSHGKAMEGIPDVSEFRKAPIFVDEDQFIEGLKAVTDNGPSTATLQPMLAWPESKEATDSDIASPESILRCRIDRGDFPWVDIELLAPGGSPDNWEKWTDHILSSSHHRDLLAKAGILRTVCAFRDLKISKNYAALETLLSRWSSDTHTFIASWGEFTVSIEDICELTGLNVIGEHALLEALDDEEQIVKTLQQWYSECASFKGLKETDSNKSSYGQWHRFCFEDVQKLPPSSKKKPIILPSKLQKDRAYLAAYIAAFLSRFLLPGSPHDCPNKLWFLLAAKLSLGRSVPISALVLGNLYTWLDQISRDMARSMGRFILVNYAPTILLMAFLYERFPNFAPRVEPLSDDGSQLPVRIQRWHIRTTKTILAACIDEESHFCMRPYASNHCTFSHNFFSETREDAVNTRRAATVLLFTPCLLPTITALGEGTVEYNPHRTMRQFGFDQGVPVQPKGFKACKTSWGTFTSKGFLCRCSELNLVFPPRNRLGHVSTNWNLHWSKQALSLVNFVFGNAVQPPLEEVPANDPTLRKPKKVGRNGNRRMHSSSAKKVLTQVAATNPLGACARKTTRRNKGKRKYIPEKKEAPPSEDAVSEVPLKKFKEAILASKRRKTGSSSSKAIRNNPAIQPSKDGCTLEELAEEGVSPTQDEVATEEAALPFRETEFHGNSGESSLWDNEVAADTPMQGDEDSAYLSTGSDGDQDSSKTVGGGDRDTRTATGALSNLLKAIDVPSDVVAGLELIDRRYPKTFEKVHFKNLDSPYFRVPLLETLVVVARKICEQEPNTPKERLKEFEATLNQFETLGFQLGWLRRRMNAGKEMPCYTLFEEYLNAQVKQENLIKDDNADKGELKWLQDRVVEVEQRRTARSQVLQQLLEEQASRQHVLIDTFSFNIFSDDEFSYFCLRK